MTVSAETSQQIRDNPDDPRHGKPATYTNHDCRCPRCKRAAADQQASRRAARRAAPMPRGMHGTDTGYREYGCRKPCCREAHRVARKASRDRTGK